MKRLLKLLIILFCLYLSIQLIFKMIGKGHKINYQIKEKEKTFEIEETFISNTKNEIDSYYFNILYNDDLFTFQTYANLNKGEMVIKEIKYFETDDYKCVLPIFSKKKIIVDLLCKKEETFVFYNFIQGQDEQLDNFVKGLKEYNINKWSDNKKAKTKVAPITVYNNNILDNHFVGINNYKGIYSLDNLNKNKIVDIKLFTNDIYIRNLETMVNNFYVVANYNTEHDFSSFYVVDLITNEQKTIKTNKRISFDSYIQGTVNNNVYIYDKDNKKQYELNIKTKSMLEVGNPETGIKYYFNGEWQRLDIRELTKKDLFFNDEGIITKSDDNYDRIDIVGNKRTGYIYYYKKKENDYKVYRSPSRNPNQKIYLFNLKNLDDIKYVYDFIYFIDGNEVKYYNDNLGVRTIFKNEEFDFNESLKYNVYFKK